LAEKIKTDEFERVCRLAKLVERTGFFTTKDNMEGLELKLGKIISFWIKDGEKLYDQPVNDTKIASVIGAFEEKPKGEKKDEKAPDKVDEKKTSNPENENKLIVLPEEVTPTHLTEWGKMRTVDRMLKFQRTPKEQIFSKPVGNGQNANYVKGNYMIKEANAAFLFDWSFLQTGINVGEKGVCVYGSVVAMVDGVKMSRPAVGYEEINSKMTPQLAIKSATTDAIKKGLSLFGFNSDVYSGEV
jgi:hypothetical protein